MASEESTGISCQPSAAQRRDDEHADRPLDPVDRVELLVGERQPRRRGDPPAAQVAGVERVGVGEHPARQVVGLRAGDREPVGERAALVVAVGVDGGVVERDRQPGVRAAQPLVQPRGGDGDRGPVQPGVAVGARLAVDQRADGGHGQPARVERGEAVAAQHGLGVFVAAAPRVGVVGVDGLVVGQPPQRGRAQVLERARPADKAARQLAAGVGLARRLEQPLALEPVAGGPGKPAPPSESARPDAVVVAAGAPAPTDEGSVMRLPFTERGRGPRAAARAFRWWGGHAGRWTSPRDEGWARAGFRCRGPARRGGCGRRRSARRGPASARARAGCARCGRRRRRGRPRRGRWGCFRRAGAGG